MVVVRRSGKAALIALCVLASPAAAMLLSFAAVEALVGIAATIGGVALLALFGIALVLSRRLLAAPREAAAPPA